MKKRVLIILLTVLLVLTSCSQAVVDDPADTKETGETSVKTEFAPLDTKAVVEVCVAWGNYLDAAQVKAQAELWGLGYLKSYCENPSAAQLQCAISAAETVVATLSEIKLSECDLSAETLASLTDSGVDMSFVPLEYDILERTIEEGEKAWDSMLHSLLTESFWEYGIEYIEGWTDHRIETVSVYNSYSGKMTNAIAISLGETREKSTWKSWEKKAPDLFGEGFTWTDDEDLIASELSGFLDRLEELTVESAKLNGVLSANYGMFETAYNTGDWTEVNSVAVDYTDHFVALPMPDWRVTNVYSYKSDEYADNGVWMTVEDDIAAALEGFIFQYEGITREDFYSYVDFLDSLGIWYYPESSTTEGESISLYYFEYCTLSLKWSENTASIYFYDREPLLVPSWYLGYLLVSLSYLN